MHIAEFRAENIRIGRIRVKPVKKPVTFHDPCQISRRSPLETVAGQLDEVPAH